MEISATMLADGVDRSFGLQFECLPHHSFYMLRIFLRRLRHLEATQSNLRRTLRPNLDLHCSLHRRQPLTCCLATWQVGGYE